MSKEVLINLPVKDVTKSKEFYLKLGFASVPELSDENATCLLVQEDVSVVLMSEVRFKAITNNEIADGTKSSEVLFALGMENREQVDELLSNALAVGGVELHEPKDFGWIYGRSFADLDHHQWNIFYKDASQMPK